MEGFSFGILVAQYMLEVPRSKRLNLMQPLYKVVKQVANGDITLVETDTEYLSDKDYDEQQKKDTAETLRKFRGHSKQTAQKILDTYGPEWAEIMEE